jgi:hypothetical protein
MGRRKISSKKNFKQKLRDIKGSIETLRAIENSILPPDWDLGSPPTLRGTCSLATPSALPIKIREEDTNELPAFDLESLLPKFSEDVR